MKPGSIWSGIFAWAHPETGPVKKLSLCSVVVPQASEPAVSRVSKPACLPLFEFAHDFRAADWNIGYAITCESNQNCIGTDEKLFRFRRSHPSSILLPCQADVRPFLSPTHSLGAISKCSIFLYPNQDYLATTTLRLQPRRPYTFQ